MAIYVSLSGTFTYEINQSGLDFNNPEDVECAIQDFINEFHLAMDGRSDISIRFEYEESDIDFWEGDD